MNGGGAEKQYLYFSKRLIESYPNTVIALFYRDKYEDIISELNLDVVQLNFHGFKNIKTIQELRKFLKVEKISIVISFLPVADLYVGLIKLSGIKFYWLSFERNSFPTKSLLEYTRRKLIFHLANGILSNSINGLRYWKHFSKIKLFYPNHIPSIKRDPFLVDEALKKYDFLFVGRFVHQKNVLQVARIFKAISDEYNCLMIGEGEMYDQIKSISQNKFEIKPFQDKIYDFYTDSKVFVNLSIHEGLPNTVIENLILGKKVILSDIPEHRDLVGDNYPFLLKLDEQDLNHRFIEILNSSEQNTNNHFLRKYVSNKEEHHQTLINHLKSLNEDIN